MTEIGVALPATSLVLTKGRDFKWTFENLDEDGSPTDFPAGSLFFEFATKPLTLWEFDIEGHTASLKAEAEDVDKIKVRCAWQLVFLPDGEDTGGDAIAQGTVKRQG